VNLLNFNETKSLSKGLLANKEPEYDNINTFKIDEYTNPVSVSKKNLDDIDEFAIFDNILNKK
jgi:hypothetical protein